MKKTLITFITLFCAIAQGSWGQKQVRSEEELAQAVKENGANIIMMNDIELSKAITIQGDNGGSIKVTINMNGKTLPAGKNALLKIGNVDISTIRLSDVQGHNVQAMAGNTTGIDAMGSKVQQQGGVFNLKGQKVAGKATDLQKLPKGVYIINGEKVVK